MRSSSFSRRPDPSWTIARLVAREHGKATWFDLETDEGLRALEQPELALKQLRGLVVIDEVQRLPDLFRVLRPIVDRQPSGRASCCSGAPPSSWRKA